MLPHFDNETSDAHPHFDMHYFWQAHILACPHFGWAKIGIKPSRLKIAGLHNLKQNTTLAFAAIPGGIVLAHHINHNK